jgi:hypothetical protein
VSQPPPPLAQLGPQLPGALGAWWERALQRDPQQRFQSASELVESFRRGLQAAADTALPAPRQKQLASPAAATRAPMLVAPARPSKSASGTQSPLSRTHAESPSSRRRRWRLLLGGAALVCATGATWLALRSKEAARGAPDAGHAVSASAQLDTLPLQELAVPSASPGRELPSAAPTPAVAPTPAAPLAEPQLSTGGAAADRAPPQVTVRPLVSPLPPEDASPWALPRSGSPASSPVGAKEAGTKPKPARARPGASSKVPATARTTASAPAASAPAASAPAASAPAAAAPADARDGKPRDLGF